MLELSVFWLRAAAVLYATGLFYSMEVAVRKTSSLFRPALISFAVGLVLHMVALVETALGTGTLLPAGFGHSVSLCGFLIGILFLVVFWRYRIESLAAFTFPLVFFMTLAAGFSAPVSAWSSRSDRDTWLEIHIVLVLLGYASLLLTAFTSLLYLIQERQLKRKKSIALLERLPPLGTLDTLISRSLSFGFILITLGVVTGATWAWIESEGAGAGLLDPRMTTALITWLACLLMVALRVTAGWRGRKAAMMAITVVACSAATWAFHYVRR